MKYLLVTMLLCGSYMLGASAWRRLHIEIPASPNRDDQEASPLYPRSIEPDDVVIDGYFDAQDLGDGFFFENSDGILYFCYLDHVRSYQVINVAQEFMELPTIEDLGIDLLMFFEDFDQRKSLFELNIEYIPMPEED